jgi:hypothetical protein
MLRQSRHLQGVYTKILFTNTTINTQIVSLIVAKKFCMQIKNIVFDLCEGMQLCILYCGCNLFCNVWCVYVWVL